MKAWALGGVGEDYRLIDVQTPEPGPGEVRVRVMASALNHMDIWLTKGRPAPKVFPHIPGGDAVGVVDAVGAGVHTVARGDEVIVDPSLVDLEALEWGLDAPLHPSLRILGEHCNGGHADLVVVPQWQIVPKPAERTWIEAAALPVASVTAWRMLRRARLQEGERVLIVGIGGGVATAAMMIARHLGAEVTVTSGDPAKRAAALELGAAHALDSSDEFGGPMDVVVETVGPATWDRSVRALRPGGRMVICGGTSGPTVELNLPRLFFKQHELIGSTMGSPVEFRELVDAFAAGLGVVVDRVFPFDAYPAALARLRNSAQLGKIVIDHSPRRVGNGGDDD